MSDADNIGNRTEEERARVQAMLQAKLNAPPAPPLEAAQKFFRSYFSDESWEEAKKGLTSQTADNPRTGLAGVEGLLANPPAKQGILFDLVAWDANWVLEDPSDEGATVWLREVAEMVRGVLGDKQPPRPQVG